MEKSTHSHYPSGLTLDQNKTPEQFTRDWVAEQNLMHEALGIEERYTVSETLCRGCSKKFEAAHRVGQDPEALLEWCHSCEERLAELHYEYITGWDDGYDAGFEHGKEKFELLLDDGK